MDAETVYGDDPAAMAHRWVEQGAECLHVVDLDGAITGAPANRPAIEEILRTVDVPVQVGGGLRELDTIERYLETGAARVVLGTRAALDHDFLREVAAHFPGKVVVAIDARDGRVAVKGWIEDAGRAALDLARDAADAGAVAVLYTDIHRDGTQQGPDMTGLESIARATSIGVIASGGISTRDHVHALARIPGVEAAIVGRALYQGSMTLRDAIDATRDA